MPLPPGPQSSPPPLVAEDAATACLTPPAATRRSSIVADLGAVASDIKLAHSVFALPFAVLAAFLAATPVEAGIATPLHWKRFGGQLALVVLAMVAARTAAMVANRLVDRDLDRDNPRTAGRAIPSGRLAPRRAVAALGLAAALFMLACAGFLAFGNPWPVILGLPVLAWICAYGWLKRFTALCHVYLGSSLAISPVAAAIAVDPSQVGQVTIWLLAGMVLCWVAGFDVIYALQDVEADRRQGLHSMPSRWGVPAALWASRLLHAAAAGLLWAATIGDPRFGLPMRIAASLVTALLIVEHLTVLRWGTSRIALSFFTLNGMVSCMVGLVGVAEVLR